MLTAQLLILIRFDSDGFTMNGSGSWNETGQWSETFVAWNWKAAWRQLALVQLVGQELLKHTLIAVNTTAGFSIISYTGTGTAGHTIPHHLGAVRQNLLL